MALDWKKMAKEVDTGLAEIGIKATVQRGGQTVGSGFGIFSKSTTTNESFQQAQLVVTKLKFTMSGLVKSVEVGDSLVAGRQTYTVTAVNATRPTTTTLVYVLEVS